MHTNAFGTIQPRYLGHCITMEVHATHLATKNSDLNIDCCEGVSFLNIFCHDMCTLTLRSLPMPTPPIEWCKEREPLISSFPTRTYEAASDSDEEFKKRSVD